MIHLCSAWVMLPLHAGISACEHHPVFTFIPLQGTFLGQGWCRDLHR